jgi:hypothetical protein
MIPLLAFGQAAVSKQDKENTCFYFTHSAFKFRFQEIDEHLDNHPDLNRKDLILKVHEDSFNYCMGKITDEEVETIGLRRIRDFKPYSHLLHLSLDQYLSPENLTVSQEFLDEREKISAQISKGNSKSQDL